MFNVSVFGVYMIGMSFYITSVTKKSDSIFHCVLEQCDVVELT